MLASHALVMLGVPLRRVVHRVQEAREQRYASLRGYFPGISDDVDEADGDHLRLHSVVLHGNAAAIGKPLQALELAEMGVEVAILRRGKVRIEALPDTILQANDIVVLRGTADGILRGEERLLK
jgi:CPA2 family monovalent cation:H+ antiporter-2